MSSNKIITASRRWVTAGGIFNCILSFPLAMPFLYEWYILLINDINTFLTLGGESWDPPTNGGNMLFLNTAGLALFLVGITLLYAARHIVERAEIPLINGLVRGIWGITAIYYISCYDIINVLYSIVATDFILAFVYIYYYFKLRELRVAMVPPLATCAGNNTNNDIHI